MKTLDEMISDWTKDDEGEYIRGKCVRNACEIAEDGKKKIYQLIEIPLKEYIDLIKDKAYEEGYSWGVQNTLDKMFGDDK